MFRSAQVVIETEGPKAVERRRLPVPIGRSCLRELEAPITGDSTVEGARAQGPWFSAIVR
jgi:hypothetical protein